MYRQIRYSPLCWLLGTHVLSIAEKTERASLIVSDVTSKHVWTSVIASGSLRAIGDNEWSELETAIEDKAWYPSLISEAEPMRDFQGWELQIDEVTGQQSER